MHKRGITRCRVGWTSHPESTNEGAAAWAAIDMGLHAVSSGDNVPDRDAANIAATEAKSLGLAAFNEPPTDGSVGTGSVGTVVE